MKIKKLFNDIAKNYDKVNNLISLWTHKLIKRHAVSQLEITPNSTILDICTGTGDIVQIIEAVHKDCKVIGTDVSENMLKIAKKKNPRSVFINGDCTDLVYRDGEFDYVTSAFGLRNVENRYKALLEINRVLKVNGKFMHLDFGYHNIFSNIFDNIVLFCIKFLKLPEKPYRYLIHSKNNFPQPDELIEEFEKAGFRYSKKIDYLFGIVSCQIVKKY